MLCKVNPVGSTRTPPPQVGGCIQSHSLSGRGIVLPLGYRGQGIAETVECSTLMTYLLLREVCPRKEEKWVAKSPNYDTCTISEANNGLFEMLS